MLYHGAESHGGVAMKWTTRIIFLVSSFLLLTVPGAYAVENVVAFAAPPERKNTISLLN